MMNMGDEPVEVFGNVILASDPVAIIDGYLLPNRTVWIEG
jgi:hypothetical protein